MDSDIEKKIKKDITSLKKRVRRLERLLSRAENADEWAIEHNKIQEGEIA